VSYVINVTGAEDVQAGIKFARENNVRLVIKNTGHEYVKIQKPPDCETRAILTYVLAVMLENPQERVACPSGHMA
jgi:hypothetical protein